MLKFGGTCNNKFLIKEFHIKETYWYINDANIKNILIWNKYSIDKFFLSILLVMCNFLMMA